MTDEPAWVRGFADRMMDAVGRLDLEIYRLQERVAKLEEIVKSEEQETGEAE